VPDKPPDKPTEAHVLWTLQKDGQTLTCEVYSHPVKEWGVRLARDGHVIRADAFRTQERMLFYAGRWQQRAIENGWQPPPT
jgi:hypothetical protein